MRQFPGSPSRCHRLTRRALIGAGAAWIAGPAAHATGLPTGLAQEASPAPADDTPFAPDEQLAMAHIVAANLASTATPGALVGVWYPGRGRWVQAAGIGDLATAAPIGVDDHVRIASITKTFVATVVLQLVDEGLVGLDDPLETYVTGVPSGTEITLRQLLGMTAGVYDYVLEPVIAETYHADPLLEFGPGDALEIIRESTPDFAPGERVQYSNSNYILLGLIIEQVTGQAVEDAISERVTAPLGLEQTSFATTTEMPTPYAHGYETAETGEALRDVTRSNPAVAWAAGAMVSTLEDLRAWALALGTGSLLSPAMLEEQRQWGVMFETPLHASYGLGILRLNGLLGHSGGIAGYSSWVAYDPEEQAVVVVVTNRSADGGATGLILMGLANFLFPDRFPDSIDAVSGL